MEKTNRYEMDMCSGPILGKMLMFAVPLMLSSVMQLLFNAADIVVVGRFAGNDAMAAVGSTSALINLMTNLFVGLSVGASVTAARYFGAKLDKELSMTVHTAAAVSLISGLALTAIGVLGARRALELTGTPDEIIGLASSYLRIYFGGITSTMVYNFGSALLRAIGDTRRPLHYLMAAGVVNFALNLLFVIVFRMDAAGVGLATVISQTISALLVVRCLMREKSGIRLTLSKVRIHMPQLMLILRIGLPAGFQGIVFSLSNVVIQSSVNSFGNIVVAGNSAAANIEGFVWVSMNAFHQAAMSFTSQNFGAGKYERINRILGCGVLCAAAAGLVLGNLAVIFAEPLLSIYTDNPEVIAAGVKRLGIISRTYALCGIMDVFVGSLRGIGYSAAPMVVSIAGVCGLRLLWLATVFQMPEYHTEQVIFLSYPISWGVTIIVHGLCYIWARGRVRKKYEAPQKGL